MNETSSPQAVDSQPFFHSLWFLYFVSLPFLYLESSSEAFALRKAVFMVLVSLQLGWNVLKPPKRPFPKPQKLDILVFAVLSLRFLSAVLAGLQNQVLFFTLDSLLFETSLLLFYLLLRREPPTKLWVTRLAQGLIFSQSLVMVLQLVAFPWVSPLADGRVSAQYFHPNVLGILTVALLAYLCSNPRLCGSHLTGINRVVFGLGVLIVLFSGSRNALLALVALCIFLKPLKWKLILLPLVCLPLIWWARSVAHPIESYRASVLTQIEIRRAVMASTLKGILEHPLGVGAGLFAARIHPYITNSLHSFFPNPRRHSLNKAHNFILELVFESGWLMLPCLLFGFFLIIQMPFSGPKSAILILLFCSLFSVFLNYPTGQIFLTLFLAMGSRES
jgi:hypothetical protein